MKRARVMLVMTTWVAVAWIASPALSGEEKVFRGEIADSQCALNVHSLNQSHKEMIAMTSSIRTDADCARYCVKERGGRFVLQSKDKVYRLDRQDLAEQFVAMKVKVTGTLDPKTGSITVRTIDAVPEPSSTRAHRK